MRVDSIDMDCNDLPRLAEFWSAMLGQEAVIGDGYAFIPPTQNGAPHICLLQVPEEKTIKNRLHIDLAVENLEAAAKQAEQLGATRATGVLAGPFPWIVMHDPEGNEFCLIPPSHYMSELVRKHRGQNADA